MRYPEFLKNPFTAFLAKAFVFYAAWWFLYNQVIVPANLIDEKVIHNQVVSSGYLLEGLGYEVGYRRADVSEGLDIIYIEDSRASLRVAKACDSLDLIGLFAIFILAFPGSWKKRLWFIPIGALIIHVLNIIRIAALCIIMYYKPESLDFAHKYTFTAIMYGFIFLLWYWWISINKKSLEA